MKNSKNIALILIITKSWICERRAKGRKKGAPTEKIEKYFKAVGKRNGRRKFNKTNNKNSYEMLQKKKSGRIEKKAVIG